MAKGGFFKNYRVYILTSVAYMGALLFGKSLVVPLSIFLSEGSAASAVLLSALFVPKGNPAQLPPL